MSLNEYQSRAMETCLPTSDNFSYMAFGLVSEVGEVMGKVAKAIRKGNAIIGTDKDGNTDELMVLDSPEGLKLEDELLKECGDVLWELAGLCSVLGWDLEDVAQANLDKLASRKKRGVIEGNGDDR